MLAFFLLACTATIRATATPDSTVLYLTNEEPSVDERPNTYVAKGQAGKLDVKVPYYTWQEWYIWATAPGYSPEVVEVPQEPKAGPIVAAVFFWWPAIWAMGPASGSTIDIELEKGTKAK